MRVSADHPNGQAEGHHDETDAWTQNLYRELYDRNRQAGLSHWLADMLAGKFSSAYGRDRHRR